MQARSALRQMRAVMGGLDRKRIPKPPTWSPARTTRGIFVRHQANLQLDTWKTWIEWEKTNPLLQENENAVYTRVIYAYKQAMMNMRFYPEIWYIPFSAHLTLGILQLNMPKVKAESPKPQNS